MGLLRAVSAGVAALCVSGCVAAAAVPLLAGGAILRTATDGEEGFDDEPVELTGGTVDVRPAPEQVAVAEASQQATARFAIVGSEFPQARPLSGDYSAFFQFALALERGDGESVGSSALLRNPGMLDAQRLACSQQDPAVLIDLDPGDQLFQSAASAKLDAALNDGLRQLRARGIAIFWISGRAADAAGSIRQYLADAGADTAGEDRLILMRYPSDSKQSRRRAIAETHCLGAIVGDQRADFDELFSYIKDPAMAAPLEPLFGDGWFLANAAQELPAPLSEGK